MLLAGFYVPLYAWQKYQQRVRRQSDGKTREGPRTFAGPMASRTCPPNAMTSLPPSSEPLSAAAKSGSSGRTRTLGRYAVLAVIDTQANYCIVKSFQYTSLTSVTLLDCAAIPFSMVLSAAMLGGRYSYKHVAGGVISIGGLAILVFADARGGGDGAAGANPALGDCLVLLAAALYASSNVMQEIMLLDGAPTTEVLAAVGGIGAIVSGMQCSILEAGQLGRLGAVAGPVGFGVLAVFAVSLFAMYSLVPDVLRRCGAAAFNIGMLSSDVWAVVARVLFFGGFGSSSATAAFVASFVTVSTGLVMFAAAGDPLPPERKGGQETRYVEVLDNDESESGGLSSADAMTL